MELEYKMLHHKNEIEDLQRGEFLHFLTLHGETYNRRILCLGKKTLLPAPFIGVNNKGNLCKYIPGPENILGSDPDGKIFEDPTNQVPMMGIDEGFADTLNDPLVKSAKKGEIKWN